jgi:hypothetical protein
MTRDPFPRHAVRIAALLLVALIAVSAAAQFQTGNIYGKVQGKDGAPLPGVTVTLTGVGAPQTFITDSGGDFRFLGLSPANTYQLKAELSGFGTAVRSGVTVNIGRNSDIAIVMAPALEQSITVTAEAPLIDTRKTGTGAVVSRAELEQIPTGRDPWVIMGQAPGVLLDRVNIGGSESGQQDIVVAKGASDTQKTFNLDGVNITDVGAIGSTPVYYDFDSFEEIQVTTGGSDPRIQTPGAQLNMVTKRGTNDFKGSARYFLTDGGWQSDASAPPEAQAYLSKGNKINRIGNYSGDIGGPIFKDKIWFWGSYAKQDIKLFTAQPVGAGLTSDNTLLKDWNGKINFQPLASNSGTYLYTYGNKQKFGRFADPTHPQETTEDQTGPTHMYKLEDTHIFSQNLYLTGLYSHVLSPFQFVPEGGNVQPYIDKDGVWHRSYFYYTTARPQTSYRGDGSYFFKTGAKLDHELKFGFGYRRAPVTSTSTYPATNVYGDFSLDQADGTHGVALLTRSGATDYRVSYQDYYIGDTITTGNLTVQGGLRFDRQKGRNSAVAIGANPLAPDILAAVTVPGDTRELQWKSVSPRIGATYTLGSSQKTLIRGSYNRYVDQLGGNVVGAGNPYNYAAGIYYYWTDANGDKTVQRSELGGIYGTYGNLSDPTNPNQVPQNARLDYSMKPPKTDEFIVGGERQVLDDFSIGVDYTYRKFTDFWWNVHEKTRGSNNFYGPSDYKCVASTTAVTLPNGKSVTPQDCFVPGGTTSFSVITNRPGYNQSYTGIDFYGTKRMSNHWMMRASFSYNDRTQHVGSGAVEDPTLWLQPPSPIANNYFGCTVCDGSIVVDRSYGTHSDTYINAKWQYNVTALYQFPWQIGLGANLTGRQGYPIPYYIRVGSKRILLSGVDGGREPDQLELDLRLAKDFTFLGHAGFTIAAEAFNILDNRPILQRQPRIYNGKLAQDPAFPNDPSKQVFTITGPFGSANRITEVQVPRVFRLSAKLTF